MVNNLQNAFDRSTKKYFDQTSSDEEPVLLEYPPIEATSSKTNSSKEKEVKKDKSKTKEKKPVKQSVVESTDEDESNNKDKELLKKSNDNRNKSSNETVKKIDKKISRENEKKKEKSTKGVKRKHKDKDKGEKPKAKKMKMDKSSDEGHEDFKFESDKSNDEESPKKVLNKKVKNGKSKEKQIETNVKEQIKVNKKSKKSETPVQTSGKRKENISDSPGDKKKPKKETAPKSEKFSKTNEKANNKKRKVEPTVDEKSESDSDSVHDLIEEKKKLSSTKKEAVKSKSASVKEPKEPVKKSKTPSSTPKKVVKKISSPSRNSKKKHSKKGEERRSMSSESFSRSPSPLPSINSSALTDDLQQSMDADREGSKSSKNVDSSFRSDTPDIKDKFDLIKERRNKMNQGKEQYKEKTHSKSASQGKEKNHKLKETIEKLKIKNEKSKSQIEFIDEVLGGKTIKKESNNVFDKLKNEGKEPKSNSGEKKKSDKSKQSEMPLKVKKIKKEPVDEKPEIKKEKNGNKKVAVANNTSSQNPKGKKQNKACLDVLDMETEQTLKDINKWLEHTPRFEYSSGSNSPSRFIIDEIDMPSKMDDNDFRKPIPLMPSSPSASHATFQSPQNPPKDFNLLKESNNNKQAAASQNVSVAGTSSKKAGSKEPKRKSLKEKLQQLPKKKEMQRTIDRLQPGKTKGNLLHNIQNINKPEEFFPLGARDKTKEIKNSLIVQTDESSPKLSLGTVLDTQSFNFNDSEVKKQDNECFDEPSLKVEEENEDKLSDEVSSKEAEDVGVKSSPREASDDSAEKSKDIETKVNPGDTATKPNLNAWFKAFGVPKKPKKSESPDESGKLSDNNDSKPESNYVPTHLRRLSTGSSISEKSSVEDSPQVGLDERLGAPAPYPSPIGASPIMASPKTEELQKQSSSNYPVNGSTRPGFYQDMTSTKSSPDKSSSPREMPSPYGQYPYEGSSSTSAAGMYGHVYNLEHLNTTNKIQQAAYSKPTTSPASYYDQYKQPHSHESDFNNSMSPSTNPNSPYHSQQSSPYQQQPSSPFQSPASGNNGSRASQAPTSPYSQPNSPYQQTPFIQSSSSAIPTNQPPKTAPQSQPSPFNNQNAGLSHIQSPTFNQHHQSSEQFLAFSSQQNVPKPSEWNQKPHSNVNANYANSQAPVNSFNVPPHQAQVNSPVIPQQQSQQQGLKPEAAFPQNILNYNKIPSNEAQSSIAPIYGSNKLTEMNPGYGGIDMVTKNATNIKESSPSVKQNETAKYLDLSKQQVGQHNQQQPHYQQMFDHSDYKTQHEYDVAKNKSVDVFNRSVQKGNPQLTAPCTTPGFWGNVNSNKPSDVPANYVSNENCKMDLTGKSPINSILNPPGSNFPNNSTVSHQQPSRNPQAASMDINYKQPLFNNSAASSMMDLTSFMRDFRQAEERFSSLSGSPGSFYDKTITPAHMFGKNLPQANSSAALQQMFNSSMTTMAYNREQHNMNLASYHNRLNSTQQTPVASNQPHAALAPQPVETKAKKPRKKKNATPEEPPISSHLQNQQHQQHHQQQNSSHQHLQHQQLQPHQQLAHQQSFQSYSGLKIPGAPGGSDPSAISLKSVVPGSAFNYGPTPLTGLYGENPAYLDEFRGTPNPYYPPPLGHRSTPDPTTDKTSSNPPPAHPQAPSSAYHHLLPPHHPSRSSYPFMNSIDPAALQQQYRMMLNQTYQAGYHPALGMHNQPPHWPHHM